MISKNRGKSLATAAVVMLLLPMLAFAAAFEAGKEVSVGKGSPIEDNFYVAGGNVSIHSTVSGDLIVAGGKVLIAENVTEDTTVAGGSISIFGDIGGDLRAAGGSILITGTVGGDLVGAGGSLNISSDASVAKDLVLAGGQISVDGNVMGNVELTGGVATINGRVQGDVIARLKDKLTIGDGAVINGNLEYHAHSTDDLELNEGATVTGEVVFRKIEFGEQFEAENLIAAVTGTFSILKLMASILTALILILLFKKFSDGVVRGVVQNPLKMLGYGFVTLVVVPVAAILLIITLLGIPLGFMTGLAYALLLLIAQTYSGIIVGAWLSQLVQKSNTAVITWKNTVAGVLVLTVVKLVPLVGWIVGFLVFLAALGSLVEILNKKLEAVR